jgi:hypothetical protein
MNVILYKPEGGGSLNFLKAGNGAANDERGAIGECVTTGAEE